MKILRNNYQPSTENYFIPLTYSIGADSSPKRNNLPEPPKEKILELIAELETFKNSEEEKSEKIIGVGG